MTKSAKDGLLAFEQTFDQSVKELSLLTLPVRVPLSALYGVADSLFHGHRLDQAKNPPRPDAGEAFICRLSYLTPLLLMCPLVPLGENALNVEGVIRENPALFDEIKTLVEYGHFCELMPEVHRKYFTIQGGADTGFVLSHASLDMPKFESQEVVLAEIALPFGLRTTTLPTSLLDAYVTRPDLRTLVLMIGLRYQELRPLVVEAPVLTEDGYRHATGTGSKGFTDFRAAWFAIADCCLALVDAYARRIRETGQVESSSLWNEFLEWRGVCLKSNFILGTVSALTGLDAKFVDQMTRLFSVGAGPDRANAARDGFFPPFWWLSDQVLMFSPEAALRMLSARNIPFALNSLDQHHFNGYVSEHLEPPLIVEARKVFESLGTKVVSNYSWASGEFDLLAYERSSNTAVHVQAKGAIAPQGARMVQSVESRTREALKQLKVVRDLPKDEQHELLSRALGIAVAGVELIDIVLTRAGIGTWKVWSELNGVIITNVQLLKLASHRASQNSATLRGVVSSLPGLLDELCGRVVKGWDQHDTHFHSVRFTFPLLRLERGELWRIRKELIEIESLESTIEPDGWTRLEAEHRGWLAPQLSAPKKVKRAKVSSPQTLEQNLRGATTTAPSSLQRVRRKRKRKVQKQARRKNRRRR